MKVNRRRMLLGGAASLAAVRGAQAAQPRRRWSQEVDVVVVGAGAAGYATAIVAREAGASVALLEAQPHIGGHAIISGGNVALGGGTGASSDSTASKIRPTWCSATSPTGAR